MKNQEPTGILYQRYKEYRETKKKSPTNARRRCWYFIKRYISTISTIIRKRLKIGNIYSDISWFRYKTSTLICVHFCINFTLICYVKSVLHTFTFLKLLFEKLSIHNSLDEVRSSIDFLNREESYGENRNSSLIVQHWKSTFSYRNAKKYINATEAITDWLPLQKLDGSVMVSINWHQIDDKLNLTSYNQTHSINNINCKALNFEYRYIWILLKSMVLRSLIHSHLNG